MMLIITLLFALFSFLYVRSLPNQYKSTALLAPASQKNDVGLSKLAGNLGGVAALAGIDISGGGEDKSAIALEILMTWGFLEEFIEKQDIAPELIAAKGWDRDSNRLVFETDVYDPESNRWLKEFESNSGKSSKPTSWQLYRAMKEKMTISRNEENGLIIVELEYYSPYLAKKWLDEIIKMLNDYLKEQDKKEALKSISYLRRQVDRANVADMRNVFYRLIEEQTKTLMLAEIRDEYALKVISPGKVAEEKSNPKRSLVFMSITFAGFMLSVCILVGRDFFSNNKS